jgi:hypothetical protein
MFFTILSSSEWKLITNIIPSFSSKSMASFNDFSKFSSSLFTSILMLWNILDFVFIHQGIISANSRVVSNFFFFLLSTIIFAICLLQGSSPYFQNISLKSFSS